MDSGIRLMIEGEIDSIIKDPSKFRNLIEGMGVETTDESLIAYISGYIAGRAVQIYLYKGEGFDIKDDKTIEFYKELEELIGRRAGEIRNAFWR